MLFEKLKIYNTREKLLERIKEYKKEEEAKRKTPKKDKIFRTCIKLRLIKTQLHNPKEQR